MNSFDFKIINSYTKRGFTQFIHKFPVLLYAKVFIFQLLPYLILSSICSLFQLTSFFLMLNLI